MNVFITCDEIVSAIHVQIRYDIADEQVMALDTHAFRAGGDEHFSAGDEHVETCVQISITHTHSQLPATSKQNL